MNAAIEKILQEKLSAVFEKLGLDPAFAFVKVSDRPDLSDFQCNGALALAKQTRKNPREIASLIAAELEKDADFAKVSVDGPGFINLSLSCALLSLVLRRMAQDDAFGIEKAAKPLKVVLDFGGPNVAKAMHVGHLRSGVIGESVQRLLRFVGHSVVSDVHLGDWGTPMGMILAEVLKHDGDLSKITDYDIDDITDFYKRANLRCKEDESAKEQARQITAKLQDGEVSYRKAWAHLRKVSVEAVKKNYEDLDVHFDLWLGESDAHETCKDIVCLAKEKGLAELDEGALIVRLDDEDTKKLPPVILEKSDGGFTYHTTDLATIKMRVEDLGAQEIDYFVDSRQSLHFEQVFKAASKLGIAPSTALHHYGFGTVNGADGKPFKTRDGGVMTLQNLINLSKDKVRTSMPAAGEVDGYGEKEIDALVTQVALSAIKFQDLKNNTASGYVFELEDFAKFDGKTGPYIQYAVARLNSILRKGKEKGLVPTQISVSSAEEKILALKLAQLSGVVSKAACDKEPSLVADYAYTLAQTFSGFYASAPIVAAETKDLAQSRLALALLTRDVLKLLLYFLGIEAPDVMLKKNEQLVQ